MYSISYIHFINSIMDFVFLDHSVLHQIIASQIQNMGRKNVEFMMIEGQMWICSKVRSLSTLVWRFHPESVVSQTFLVLAARPMWLLGFNSLNGKRRTEFT